MQRLLRSLLAPLFHLGLPAALGWWLAGAHTRGSAIAIAAALFAAAALVGCVLLRLSRSGQIPWLYRAGSLLLPFGQRIGRGSLARMAIGAVLSQTLLAALGTLARNGGIGSGAPGSHAFLVLLVVWAVDGLAALWIVHLLHGYRLGSSGANGLLRVILFLLILIAASAVLHHYGWTWLGVLVAGLPPAGVGTYYGLYLLVFSLGGRGRRWS